MNGGCAMGRETLHTSEHRLHENCLDVHGGFSPGGWRKAESNFFHVLNSKAPKNS